MHIARRLAVSVLVLVAAAVPPEPAGASGGRAPRVVDDRLELTLFARDPDVMTPIGIAVDARNRVFVLESHTHLPGPGYAGPSTDVVKLLEDTRGRGRADRVTVFADGFEDGMTLAFSPAGELYLVTARGVWVLFDRDGDGVSEARTRVLELAEPERVYPHAALLGIVFSADGWMYVSRGNTGGAAWTLVGTDGSRLSGYGDGGNVVRARPDGSALEEVATGFWNPFALEVDDRGRLLAADNDPDSRGPNRLVHVVPGGDYGYHSLYGESGLHPYLAWNGELPGTLPLAVPLGEAPSGLLNASLTSWPADYRDTLLCTLWEESRIVRIRHEPRGVSLTGSTELLVEGGADFRPVAFAVDRTGAVLISDWVLRHYPSHGRGRIWRLSARPSGERLEPRARFAPPLADPDGAPLVALAAAADRGDVTPLIGALTDPDPFVRSTAIAALTRPAFRRDVIGATRHHAPDVRLGALLALHRAGHEPAEGIAGALLADPDERVRRMTLTWIGRTGMASLHSMLDRALSGPVSPALFETYLETVRFTSRAFVGPWRARAAPAARHLPRPLPPRLVESIVRDTARSPAVRAVALIHLEDPQAHVPLLTHLARAGESASLRVEAVRTLAATATDAGASTLAFLARDTGAPTAVRAEALLALARQPGDHASAVLPLLDDPDEDVRIEAARLLRSFAGDESVRPAVERALASAAGDTPFLEQLAFITGRPEPRPGAVEEWQALLAAGGNPERGRRVFFSTHSTCAMCHAAGGRGGDLGPDLTSVGQSKTRRQLVDAILRPSAEISPEWQGWYVRLTSGVVHQGRQIDVGESAIDLLLQASGMTRFERDEVADYGLAEASLMPEGLASLLTVSDMRDLVAFMERSGEATGR